MAVVYALQIAYILTILTSQYVLNPLNRVVLTNLIIPNNSTIVCVLQIAYFLTIGSDLDQIVLEWNVHRIRRSRNSTSPCGRPAIMFEMPSLYQTKSFLTQVPVFAVDASVSDCIFHSYPCNKDFFGLCDILMMENGYILTNDPYKAVYLYVALRGLLKDNFN